MNSNVVVMTILKDRFPEGLMGLILTSAYQERDIPMFQCLFCIPETCTEYD